MQTRRKRKASCIWIRDRTIAYIPPVARAVLTGDPNQVVMALEKRPEQINAKVEAVKGKMAGYTPLILAAAISNVKIAYILLSRGANVAILDDYHRSALWYAAFGENAAVTEALLQNPNGAAKIVNEADNSFRRTPLHLAVRGYNPAVAQLLMQHGDREIARSQRRSWVYSFGLLQG